MNRNKFVWWYTKPRGLGISIGGWFMITLVLASYILAGEWMDGHWH